MTNPDYTALVLVIDRSGSMHSIAAATQDALEEYLNGQSQLDGKLTVDTVFFDNKIEERDHLAEAKDVDLSLKPRGATSLLDAIGSKINSFGQALAEMSEEDRPGKVLFVIATDGQENSSTEFTGDDISKMIKTQQDEFSWKFVFIGANQDAVQTAKSMNIAAADSITYDASNLGTQSVVGALRGYTTQYRAGEKAAAFSDSDRVAAMQSDASPVVPVQTTRGGTPRKPRRKV